MKKKIWSKLVNIEKETKQILFMKTKYYLLYQINIKWTLAILKKKKKKLFQNLNQS